jgi:thiol-disulfide isomerase/thioredoxin
MKLKLILYLFVFTFFLNCKKNNLPENDSKVSKSSIENTGFKSNKVVITGTTDDIPAFKVLNIMNNTYLFGRPHIDFTKNMLSDSIYIVLNSIEKPILSQILTASKAFYEGYAFLIPGDTISIKIKNGVMKFYGKNAILNNFYSEMNTQTPAYNKNPYVGSLEQYKEKVASIYNKKLAFLYQYIKNNNIESELFINTYKTHLRHEYLFTLIFPKNIKTGFNDNYIGEVDGLIPLIQKETSNNSEIILDLPEYFGKISIVEFKDENALNNSSFFKDHLNSFIRYYFLDPEFTPYSTEKFIAEKEFIQKNFDGEIENYAITRMLRDFHLKGFGNSKNTIEIMENLISEYESKFTKPSYIEYMSGIKDDLKTYNFTLTDYALNSKFININGDTLSLKDVFNRSNKRIKVLDFWASWCPPCIEQIKEGKDFKDKLSVKYNVEWIYISPEKDYEKWESANKKYKHTLNFYNSFYLLKGRSSALSKFFKIDQIPRYIIFDQQNTIILNNAPSPSDEKVFESIIDDIYNKK